MLYDADGLASIPSSVEGGGEAVDVSDAIVPSSRERDPGGRQRLLEFRCKHPGTRTRRTAPVCFRRVPSTLRIDAGFSLAIVTHGGTA
jgi:hypothetical protein